MTMKLAAAAVLLVSVAHFFIEMAGPPKPPTQIQYLGPRQVSS